MKRLLINAMLMIQLVITVLFMGVGVALIILGLMEYYEGRRFPLIAVVGVVFLCGNTCVLHSWPRRRRKWLAAADGDVSAAQELAAVRKRTVRWIMRINGPLVCLLCLGMGVPTLFATELPVRERLLGCGISCGAIVLLLALTIWAWRPLE